MFTRGTSVEEPPFPGVRQEGIGFVLAPAGQTGYGPAGEALSKHPADWGVELLGRAGHVFVFRLK